MMVEAFDSWERLEKECGQQLYTYVDIVVCRCVWNTVGLVLIARIE